MKNISKIGVVVIVVIISSIVLFKNTIDKNKMHVVSDVESKDTNYEEKDNYDYGYDSEDNELEEKDIQVNKESDIQVSKDSEVENSKITVYISGEVKTPGVVELSSDDRLADGVSICGGVTDDANLNGINLAMKIQDEGHYIIPKIGDEIVNNTVESHEEVNKTNSNKETNENIALDQEEENNNKINLNTATVLELDSLPGFGEITAQKIIDYREENNQFNSIDEIKNIKGIGDKKFNDVKDYICVQ
ncbi:MAG: helix-hairpin-helix domain-containing protein [Paraclostridium sp.]